MTNGWQPPPAFGRKRRESGFGETATGADPNQAEPDLPTVDRRAQGRASDQGRTADGDGAPDAAPERAEPEQTEAFRAAALQATIRPVGFDVEGPRPSAEVRPEPFTKSAPLNGPALADRLGGRPVASAGGLLLPMRSGAVIVSVVPSPLKLTGLADDMAQRALWPEWRVESPSWRSHVVVSAFGETKSFALAKLCAEDVLRVSAVLAAQSRASGVLWTASGLMLPAAAFARAIERTPLPVEVLFRWISRAGSGTASARTGLTTLGLHLFGLPEIDQPPTGENLVVLCERLLGVAGQLLSRGTIPRDGEVIGLDERVVGRIRHAQDADGRQVLVIMPG
jgi:hypothetical protein